MGLIGSVRSGLLGFAWPLAVISFIFSCIIAATGNWKPRGVCIVTAILSGFTILVIPFFIIVNLVGSLRKFQSPIANRLISTFLTGCWLATWVWMATQLNKFHCDAYDNRRTSTIGFSGPTVGNPVNIARRSLYAHGHDQVNESLLEHIDHGEDKSLVGRLLGTSGLKHYKSRCRLYKGLLALSIIIFTLLAADLLMYMFSNEKNGHHQLGRSDSRSTSVSSASSVGSPRIGSQHGHNARNAGERAVAGTESKV